MEKSQSIKNIGTALSLFQTKMEKVKKDATNPYFKSKYATLSTILESIQLPLAESGLAFTQHPDGDTLCTILIHTQSGEYLQSSYAIHPAKVDPQGIGSAITYARRYALSAILGINVDEDDDANLATGKQLTTQQPHVPGKISPNTEGTEIESRPWLSEGQFNGAMKRIEAGEAGIVENVKKNFRIKKDFREALEQAEKFSQALIK